MPSLFTESAGSGKFPRLQGSQTSPYAGRKVAPFAFKLSMHLEKLPNYLRTYRKRAGLTQDEVAYLLGNESGTQVSRYEHFLRQPSLRTVVAYEVIFGAPAREMFAGVALEIARVTITRAYSLAEKLQCGCPSRQAARKLQFLEALVSPEGRMTDPLT